MRLDRRARLKLTTNDWQEVCCMPVLNSEGAQSGGFPFCYEALSYEGRKSSEYWQRWQLPQSVD